MGRECRTHSGKKRKDKAISLLAGGEVAPAPQKELGTSCLFCITPAPGLLQKTAANSMRMRRTAGHVAIMSLLLYGKRQRLTLLTADSQSPGLTSPTPGRKLLNHRRLPGRDFLPGIGLLPVTSERLLKFTEMLVNRCL